jgi:hypothetical protein
MNSQEIEITEINGKVLGKNKDDIYFYVPIELKSIDFTLR